jgi:hypothetical protein
MPAATLPVIGLFARCELFEDFSCAAIRLYNSCLTNSIGNERRSADLDSSDRDVHSARVCLWIQRRRDDAEVQICKCKQVCKLIDQVMNQFLA